MMHNNHIATRQLSMLSPINHLSGLNRPKAMSLVFLDLLPHTLLTIPKAQKEKRGVIFKRAEKYVKEYRDQEREKIRLSRAAKQNDSFYIPAEEKLVFVVRIKGSVSLMPSPRAQLMSYI
jgi:hypothetical protein